MHWDGKKTKNKYYTEKNPFYFLKDYKSSARMLRKQFVELSTHIALLFAVSYAFSGKQPYTVTNKEQISSSHLRLSL